MVQPARCVASLLWGVGEISSRSYSAGQCFKCSAGDTSGGHQWRHQSPERRLQLLEIVDFVDRFWIGLELEASAAEAGAYFHITLPLAEGTAGAGARSPEQPQ